MAKTTSWKPNKPLKRAMRKGELKKAGYGKPSPSVFAPKKKKC